MKWPLRRRMGEYFNSQESVREVERHQFKALVTVEEVYKHIREKYPQRTPKYATIRDQVRKAENKFMVNLYIACRDIWDFDRGEADMEGRDV